MKFIGHKVTHELHVGDIFPGTYYTIDKIFECPVKEVHTNLYNKCQKFHKCNSMCYHLSNEVDERCGENMEGE